MSDETKRTPGDWHAGHIGEGEYRCECVFDANSGQVCEIIGRGEQAEADAAYIVRCCNSHAALVVALAVMVDHACEAYPHFEDKRGQTDIANARAALALAGEVAK